MTPALAATIALVVILAGYTLFCLVSPFGMCPRCHGTGRRRRLLGERPCTWCSSTGSRMRPGARLVAAGIRMHRAARTAQERREVPR